MAGRVVDLARAARASGEGRASDATVFEGEHLALRHVVVAPGERLRVETTQDEEQVWLALSGSGRYRPDPMGREGGAEPFRPGEAAILRTNEWFAVENDADAPLVLVAVTGPQPGARV